MKKFILLSLLAFNSFANPDLIFKNINPLVEGLEKENIHPTKIDGIYEVILTSPMIDSIFVSKDGKFIIQGSILDIDARGQMAKSPKVKELIKQKLDSVKDKDKIIFKAKNEKYSIDVFTDVDCPFCKRIHAEIPKLNELGITVKYVASPLASLHPQAQAQMEKIWCAKDRAKAMDDYKKRDIVPDVGSCDNPVAEQIKVAEKIGVNGTPAIFLANGDKIAGYLPAQSLLNRIKQLKQLNK